MKKHFVTFCSPGTLISAKTTNPIDNWNVAEAQAMAKDITERHGATPYGFYFTTRTRDDNELDSRESERSCMYYLGGEIQTLAQVKARNDPSDRILILNMESNQWDKVIVNKNSWQFTAPLEKDDVVL